MILALYSKGRFEKEAKGVEPGDVFAIDRYTSKHKTFDALADLGSVKRNAHAAERTHRWCLLCWRQSS